MSRFIRFFLWGAAALVALFIVAIAAFALLFDPNAFRDDITRLVESKTGRQLTIEGDLALSFFPWLGFDAGRTTLSNPQGFSEPVMASFESASASVKLLPLFSRRIEISSVTLDGVDLRLEVAADGKTNWDDLAALGESGAADPTAGGSGFSAERIGGVRLTGANLVYTDETGDSYRLSKLDLETGALEPGKPFSITATGDLVATGLEVEGPATFGGEGRIDDEGVMHIDDARFGIDARGEGVPGESMVVDLRSTTVRLFGTTVEMDRPQLELSGTGSGDPWKKMEAVLNSESLKLANYERYDLPGLVAKGKLTAPGLPGDSVDFTMSGDRLQGSLDRDSAAIDVVRLETLGLSVFSKKVVASRVFEAPVIEAPIEVAQFSPIALLKKLGFDEIVTADKTALTSAAFSGEAKYAPDSIGLKNLVATVDQTAVSGNVRMMSDGEIRFTLIADEVDLDRYRAPAEEAQQDGEAVGIAEIEIPAEQLRELALNGTLKVGKLRLVGINTTDLDIAMRAAGGDVRVKPASAKLYGGTFEGDIRLDASGDLPVLSLNQRLQDVQFGPFSEDLLDASRLTGTLSGRLAVTGSGLTSTAITGSANGDADFRFADGAYEGINLWDRVRRARAMIGGQAAPDEPVENRTRFGNLSGTATLRDGVMRSDDIAMVLPFMKVRGEGSLNLLSQAIDFRFKGDVVDRPELDAGTDDLVGFTIPIKVGGTASAPEIGIDMGAVMADIAKRKLAQKLGLGGGDAAEGEAAADPIEEKKQEIEDKVKDKLKGLFGGG